MEQRFEASKPIGEIVAAFPTASLVFKKHRIDFCCSGDRPLVEAVEAKGLNVDSLVKELNDVYEEAARRKDRETDWAAMDDAALVDHIVSTHHAYLKNELTTIGEFVARIRDVHGAGHPELYRLDEMYRTVKSELEEHMVKEETLVFPLITQYAVEGRQDVLAQAVARINELEAEHSAVGDLLSKMRDVTAEYSLPADACRTYTVSFQKLEELEDDMFQHIHLENNILFPRLEKELMSVKADL